MKEFILLICSSKYLEKMIIQTGKRGRARQGQRGGKERSGNEEENKKPRLFQPGHMDTNGINPRRGTCALRKQRAASPRAWRSKAW